MLIIPPIPFRRRRTRLRAAAPAGLTIVSVTISTVINTQLIVTFSGAIVWNGVDVPTAFKAFTDDGIMDPCVNVVSVGADWMELEFNAGVQTGAAWEVDGAMAGISPAVAWPQSGTVE